MKKAISKPFLARPHAFNNANKADANDSTISSYLTLMNADLDELAKNDIFTQGLFCCRAPDLCINAENVFLFTKRKSEKLALEFCKEAYIFQNPFSVN